MGSPCSTQEKHHYNSSVSHFKTHTDVSLSVRVPRGEGDSRESNDSCMSLKWTHRRYPENDIGCLSGPKKT